MKCAIIVATLWVPMLRVVFSKSQLAATPPLGWNSWNRFGCDISEELIRDTADAMVDTGLRDLGYIYLNVDDCWASTERDEDGFILPADNFPSGMKDLGDYIHSKGLKFGIYSSAGDSTCAGRAGSLGFEKQDAQKYAEWGVDYLKYDNCGADNDAVDAFPRYKNMSDALRATGRDIFYSLCEWGLEKPQLWAPAIANMWRTTADIFDDWTSVQHNFWWQEPFLSYGHPGAWLDPDMLQIDNGGLTHVQEQSHFALWAVVKAPLLIGNDLTNISPEALEILSNEEIIAVHQDPLGLPALRMGDPLWNCGAAMHVFAGPLDNGDVVVALYNHIPGVFCGDAPVKWEQVGFKKDAQISVRDLITHEDKGTFTESYPYPGDQISGFSTGVLRLSPVDGSTHHLIGHYRK